MQSQAPVTFSTSTAEAIIRSYAALYGVSGDELYQTLKCESSLDPEAIGDQGTSFGISQIHLPAHPDISKKQALDPLWAIDYAAHQFSLNHQSMWTCARILGYVK